MKYPERIDFAMEQASKMRKLSSEYRQLGLFALAAWLLENAKKAEKWAVKQS